MSLAETPIEAALRHYGLIVAHCATERDLSPEATHRAMLRVVHRENGDHTPQGASAWAHALALLDADEVADDAEGER
jgi:hypothetical protein